MFLPFGKNALSTLAFSVYVQRLRGSKRSSAFFVRGSVWAAHFFVPKKTRGERNIKRRLRELERTVVFTNEALIEKIEACKKGDETFSETVQRLCNTAIEGLQWEAFGEQ